MEPRHRSVGFWADSRIKLVALEGSVPGSIGELSIRDSATSGTFTDDGGVVFGNRTSGGLFRIVPHSASVKLTAIDASRGDRAHLYPQMLPDGAVPPITILTNTAALLTGRQTVR